MTENKGDDCLVPGFKDVSAFSEVAFRAMMSAIRASNSLPSAGDDFDYYSSFESFRNLMDMEGNRLLHTIHQIMRYHGVRGNLSTNAEALEVEDKYDILVDANDQLLERIGTYLDEAAGLRKQENPLVIATMKSSSPVSGSWNKTPTAKLNQTRSSNFRLLAAKNIQRPQTKFKDKINNSYQAFVPKLVDKPNALKPFHESMVIDNTLMSPGGGDVYLEYPHPYQYELDNFMPLPSQLKLGQVIEPIPLTVSDYTLVQTEEQLKKLVVTLKGETEVAVDLEHHQYRTFQGITCLMQVSTRKQDFIVDTLELRSEMQILNEVFTDPNIVKVFHGADLDILWLQRDFGLYIVNLFDTGQAARILNFSRFSLAHVASLYCQVELDKQYQLADWRIRPLPEELLKYAREDTHYLLYIFDRMRTELIQRGNDQNNLLQAVIDRSTALCAKRYEKAKFDPEGYMDMYKKSKKVFNTQQLLCLEKVYSWRDATARKEDESLGYVLPNHMLLQICENLPKEPQGVLACCNPIPPLVRQNLNQIHAFVREAREKPMKRVLGPPKPQFLKTPTKKKTDILLSSPHDMSHLSKEKTECSHKGIVTVSRTSTLLNQPQILKIQVKDSPILTAFGHQVGQATKSNAKAAAIHATFVNSVEKFLPEPVLAKMKRSCPEVVKWKLLPNTIKIEMSTPVQKGPIPQAAVDKEDIVKFSTETSPKEEEKSVRQQHPKERKRPKPEASGTTDKSHIGEKKTKFSVPEEEFQAYDYNKTDYSVFDSAKKSKKSHFNPDSEMGSGGKHKAARKNKQFSSSHKKSLTYSKNSPATTSKIQWPKK